jgi:hypothetical protein
VAAARLFVAVVVVVVQHQLQTAIAVVSAESAAGSSAAEACQDVQQLLGPPLGEDQGWARHMLAGQRAGVVRVCFQGVGSVAAASGLVEARIGAGLRWEVVGSAVVVAGAREGKKEVVGRIGRLAEARSIAVGSADLSRVSAEVWNERSEAQKHAGGDVP